MTTQVKIRVLLVAGVMLGVLSLTAWLGLGMAEAVAPKTTGVRTVSVSSTSLTIGWDHVPTRHGYEFEYQRSAYTNWSNIAVGGSYNAYTLNVSSNTTYKFRVRWWVQYHGEAKQLGDWSDIHTVTTPKGPPRTVTGLSSTAKTTTSVALSWNAPSSDYTIDDYEVAYLERGETSWVEYPGTLTTTSVEITGLTRGQTYGFRVRAHSSAGNGPWSSNLSVTTSNPPEQVGRPDTDQLRQDQVVHTLDAAPLC